MSGHSVLSIRKTNRKSSFYLFPTNSNPSQLNLLERLFHFVLSCSCFIALSISGPPWVHREAHFDSREQIPLALSIPAVQREPSEVNKKSLAHRPF